MRDIYEQPQEVLEKGLPIYFRAFIDAPLSASVSNVSRFKSISYCDSGNLRDFLWAFTRFSYEYSSRTLVVADLGAIVLEDRIIMMDPVIHSTGRCYGSCDQSQTGIDAYLKKVPWIHSYAKIWKKAIIRE